ncbi:MAG: hypothetical protein IPK76_27065 [Lewinellaceae bacterium]|jgi:hypothetical protein|nr:hypothetical protein [Lewinellaceae bacterium]
MKHLTVIALLSCGLFMASCSKDSEPPGTNAGSGSVSAKVNGQAWSSKNDASGAIFVESQGTHSLQAIGADNSFISVLVPVSIASGQTYTTDNDAISAQYKTSFQGADTYAALFGLGSGTITFSVYNSDRVKGTFEFTGVKFDANGNQTEIKVEDGVFDIEL